MEVDAGVANTQMHPMRNAKNAEPAKLADTRILTQKPRITDYGQTVDKQTTWTYLCTMKKKSE